MKTLAVVILLALVFLSAAAVLLMLVALISRVRRRKSVGRRLSRKDRSASGMIVPSGMLAEYHGGIDKVADASIRELFEKGLSLKQNRSFLQAVNAFKKCLNGNLTSEQEAGLLVAIGNCYFAANKYAQAREHYEKASGLATQSGNEKGRLSSLINLGLLSAVGRKWDEGIKSFGEAIALDRKLGYAKGEAIDLNTLALLYENKGESEYALTHYKASLLIFEKLDDGEKVELVENNIRRVISLVEKTSA
ncbi:MAG: tetratricopeptide repeat protein [Candidatus Zixiibacteriota bacterium]